MQSGLPLPEATNEPPPPLSFALVRALVPGEVRHSACSLLAAFRVSILATLSAAGESCCRPRRYPSGSCAATGLATTFQLPFPFHGGLGLRTISECPKNEYKHVCQPPQQQAAECCITVDHIK